ncbi:MAG: MgtC/SapB family protein [Candidatus Paceibacterota bacterium]|nr:MAG: MgtC/SapB family protein [Candidatus Paceibacterota bacterium]
MELLQEYMPYLQLILALALGVILGLERTFAGKVAGVRTFGLVSMGACLLIISSVLVNQNFIGITNFDPMRLAAGIITGIGFIGAGLIILKENKLEGLTTAAGLWVSCGIGIAVGFKLFGLAVFAAFLVFLTFTLMWFVEDKFRKTIQKNASDYQGPEI